MSDKVNDGVRESELSDRKLYIVLRFGLAMKHAGVAVTITSGQFIRG